MRRLPPPPPPPLMTMLEIRPPRGMRVFKTHLPDVLGFIDGGRTQIHLLIVRSSNAADGGGTNHPSLTKKTLLRTCQTVLMPRVGPSIPLIPDACTRDEASSSIVLAMVEAVHMLRGLGVYKARIPRWSIG